MRGRWWIQAIGLVLLACSGPGIPDGRDGRWTGGSAGSWAGTATAIDFGGSANGGSNDSGATNGGTVAGGGGGALVGGTSALGGTSGSDGLGGNSGGGTTADGVGGTGSEDAGCIIERLHLKVSGGMTFEHADDPADTCGTMLTGGDGRGYFTFFVKAPEAAENTILISAIVDDISPGELRAFTPNPFTVATTAAIWSVTVPDPEKPLECSVRVDRNERANSEYWRLAGSLTCPSPLSGVGAAATTPLTFNAFEFSTLTRSVAAP